MGDYRDAELFFTLDDVVKSNVSTHFRYKRVPNIFIILLGAVLRSVLKILLSGEKVLSGV